MVSGTSPWTIFCASPSTTAVLPTPGSPTSTGLFLVRRDSTCITRAGIVSGWGRVALVVAAVVLVGVGPEPDWVVLVLLVG